MFKYDFRQYGFLVFTMISVFLLSSCWWQEEKVDIIADLEEDQVVTEVESQPEDNTPQASEQPLEKAVSAAEKQEKVEPQDSTSSEPQTPDSEEPEEEGIVFVAKKVDSSQAQTAPVGPQGYQQQSPVPNQPMRRPYVPQYVPPEPYEPPGPAEQLGDFVWHLIHPFSQKSEYDREQKLKEARKEAESEKGKT